MKIINKKNKVNRKVRYLCPKCFYDSNIEVIKYPEIKFSKENVNVDNSDAKNIQFVTDSWLDIYGKCKKCESEVSFIDIDSGFVKIIQYLNSADYITKFCCEGHHIKDEYNYDNPYLIFLCNWDDKTYYKLLDYLPESWQMWKRNISKGEYRFYQEEILLRCTNYYKYPDCMKDLEDYIFNHFPHPYYPRNIDKEEYL